MTASALDEATTFHILPHDALPCPFQPRRGSLVDRATAHEPAESPGSDPRGGPRFAATGDASLKSAADELRAAVRSGADITQDEILVPAFALVLESTRRVHGIALFDTQLLAGMAMARGAIAEMATGEGKTLAAALPAMLFSLRGPGVHVATPNAYLAQRDFERVGPILQLLGASVGLVPEAGRRKRQASGLRLRRGLRDRL